MDKPDVSKRTIQNDINILEADYGIMLDEKLKRGKKRLYRYVDTNHSITLFRINDEERHKLQDAIRVLESFEGEPMYDWARTLLMQVEGGLFTEESTPVVSFQTNPNLKGINLFEKLLQTIIKKRVLKIEYAPFGKDSYSERIYPYHLKQFNDRWYLIAQAVGYDSLGHYALDRIESFEEISMPFKESDVDFEEYFDDVIGITVPEHLELVDVVMRVSRKPQWKLFYADVPHPFSYGPRGCAGSVAQGWAAQLQLRLRQPCGLAVLVSNRSLRADRRRGAALHLRWPAGLYGLHGGQPSA